MMDFHTSESEQMQKRNAFGVPTPFLSYDFLEEKRKKASLLTKYIYQNKDSKMQNRCTFMSLPPGGRLLRVIPLRIVGSGFCLIARGLSRAMFAPDVSVGKAENAT